MPACVLCVMFAPTAVDQQDLEYTIIHKIIGDQSIRLNHAIETQALAINCMDSWHNHVSPYVTMTHPPCICPVYSMSHCTACLTVQHVSLYSMSHCTACLTVQHVSLYSMSH